MQRHVTRQGERPQIPPDQVLLSSPASGWADIILEQHIRPAAEHVVPALDEHTLLLVVGQPVRMTQQRDGCRDERHVGAGDLVLVPAGMETTCRWDRPLEIVHVRIPQRLLTTVAAEAEVAHPERLTLISQFQVCDPQLEQLTRALQLEVQSQGLGGRLYAASLANLLAIQLLRSYANLPWHAGRPARAGAPPFVRRVTDYIHDNLHADLTLGDMAATVGMSPYHFARTFKQTVGYTPHQYVIRQRVERARQLLLSTNQTVVQVAVAVGFYDQGHLARHMRRILGVSPHLLQGRKNLR